MCGLDWMHTFVLGNATGSLGTIALLGAALYYGIWQDKRQQRMWSRVDEDHDAGA